MRTSCGHSNAAAIGQDPHAHSVASAALVRTSRSRTHAVDVSFLLLCCHTLPRHASISSFRRGPCCASRIPDSDSPACKAPPVVPGLGPCHCACCDRDRAHSAPVGWALGSLHTLMLTSLALLVLSVPNWLCQTMAAPGREALCCGFQPFFQQQGLRLAIAPEPLLLVVRLHCSQEAWNCACVYECMRQRGGESFCIAAPWRKRLQCGPQ